MKTHYIINSTNEIEEYIEFTPSCYQMWKKHLDCVYVLAFITDRKKSDPLVKRVKSFVTNYIYLNLWMVFIQEFKQKL